MSTKSRLRRSWPRLQADGGPGVVCKLTLLVPFRDGADRLHFSSQSFGEPALSLLLNAKRLPASLRTPMSSRW